jgi:hypothetical protein
MEASSDFAASVPLRTPGPGWQPGTQLKLHTKESHDHESVVSGAALHLHLVTSLSRFCGKVCVVVSFWRGKDDLMCMS